MSEEKQQADNAEPTPSDAPLNLDNPEVIDDIVSQLFPSPPEAEAAPEPAEAQAEAQPEPRDETGTTDPEPEQRAEALSPQLAEISRREREARAKIEAAEQSKQAAVEQAQKAFLQELMNNPQEFIAKHGIETPGDIAMHFYAAELGDEAPDDLKQLLGQSKVDRLERTMEQRIAAMEQKFAEERERVQLQATIDQYKGFLADVPSDYKYLGIEAQHDSTEVLRSMADVADFIRDTQGRVPTASEVARVLEDQIQQTVARYNQAQEPAAEVKPAPQKTTKSTAPNVAKESPTLSNELSGSSAKPLPVGEDELLEDAIAYFTENLAPNYR